MLSEPFTLTMCVDITFDCLWFLHRMSPKKNTIQFNTEYVQGHKDCHPDTCTVVRVHYHFNIQPESDQVQAIGFTLGDFFVFISFSLFLFSSLSIVCFVYSVSSTLVSGFRIRFWWFFFFFFCGIQTNIKYIVIYKYKSTQCNYYYLGKMHCP